MISLAIHGSRLTKTVPLPNLLLEGSVALLQRQAGSQHSCCHFVTIVVITLLQRQAGCHWNHPIYRHIRCWHQHHCHCYHHPQYCKYCKPWQRPLWSQLKWTIIIIIIFSVFTPHPSQKEPIIMFIIFFGDSLTTSSSEVPAELDLLDVLRCFLTSTSVVALAVPRSDHVDEDNTLVRGLW